ncbi:asparagine synthase-related protein [Gammaproteobacteria bacterium]|nr:asparagine synthase-related protein [Gammaproteobacteria bacterium]
MNFLKILFGEEKITGISVIEAVSIETTCDMQELAKFLNSNIQSKSLHYNTDEYFGENIYFFKNDQNHIVFSKSIKLILETFSDQEVNINLDQELTHAYYDAGFIIPPFTPYERIFVLPQYSRICFINDEIIIDYYHPALEGDTGFEGVDEFSETLKRSTQSIAKRSAEDENLICTLSGGADSSILLYYLSQCGLQSLYSYTCSMPSAPLEEVKAKKISKQLDIENIVFNYNEDKSSDYVDQFVEKNLMPVYDPIVPVFSSMIESLNSNKRFSDKRNIIIEGQSADTIFLGLPHNILINLYTKNASYIFKFLNLLMPRYNQKNSLLSRFFYRLIKLIDALSEATWHDAFLRSLDHDKSKYPKYYSYLSELLLDIFKKTKNKHHSISIFFLYINQIREFQKYRLLPENFEIQTPYLRNEIISKSMHTKSTFFTKGLKKKIPIFLLINRMFPGIIRDNQTLPFYVNYKFDSKTTKNGSEMEEDSYLSLKRYSIILIKSYIDNLNTKNHH